MRPLIITFIFVLFAYKGAFAQLSIINDMDGYVNVREGKSSKAKVIGKLFDGEIFSCGDENVNDQWLWVGFESKNLTTFNSARPKIFSSVENGAEAFVHRSRVVHISDLPKMKLSKEWRANYGKLVLANDSVKFIMSKAPFVAKNHRIHISKPSCAGCGEFVDQIDGKNPIGEDGGLPSVEIKKIELTINGNQVLIPADCYNDLYQPELKNLGIHYDNKGNVYILMAGNSDGAGGYDVVWVVNHHRLIARYFDSID